MINPQIERVSTGVAQLDAFLSGGFPKRSLILVTGNPGTGKTTLTASFLYDGAKRAKENAVYASFGESKKSFFENMSSVGLDFESLEGDGHFRYLEVFAASRQGMSEIAKHILSEVSTFGAKRLVIDSYSAMAQALGGEYEGRQILQTFFNRVMKTVGCTTLLIAEQPSGEFRIGDTSEEFVSDGVLSLKLEIPRELEIRKMRGTMIRTRNLLYTLNNGFEVVTSTHKVPRTPSPWRPIKDSGDLLSTGSPDLDTVLGGGLPRGSYAVLEVSDDATVSDIRFITRALTLNFITQGRGVMMIPMAGVDGKSVRASVLPYTTEAAFDNFMRISEQVEREFTGQLPQYALPVRYGEGSGREAELTKNSEAFYAAYRQVKAKTNNQPVLRHIAYDNLESSYARYPEKLLNEVGIAMVRTHAAGDVTLAVSRQTGMLIPKVRGMVDWHLKLWKKHNVVLFQGVKPYTNVYAVDSDVSSGYPVTTLKILT